MGEKPFGGGGGGESKFELKLWGNTPMQGFKTLLDFKKTHGVLKNALFLFLLFFTMIEFLFWCLNAYGLLILVCIYVLKWFGVFCSARKMM